jgi:serine/threonine protein kinase
MFLSMSFTGTDRFRIVRLLGSGSFGVVYEARDEQRGRSVALKLLQKVSPDALYRFKREFRSLAGIRHPNLVGLYELLSDGDDWFYTMELIHGTELLEHLAGQEIERALLVSSRLPTMQIPFDGETATEVAAPTGQHYLSPEYLHDLHLSMRQLVEGISALHAAEKLHRDIKPSNILVTADGRLVLLDFGLIREFQPEDFEEFWLVGTPGYMSPEQTAGHDLTPASDWYSVGVILYQALSGAMPFSGSFADIAAAQKTQTPAPPSSIIGGVPPHLERLCMALLERDPAARPGVADIREALGGTEFTLWLPPFRTHRREQQERFVGRARQLLQLQEKFDEVASSGGVHRVDVHGTSGVGKTALVNRFLDDLRGHGEVVILGGRCYEKESVPFKALDDIVDSLTRFMKKLDPSQLEELRGDVAALNRLFPVFGRVDAFARDLALRSTDMAMSEIRSRAFSSFADLLLRLSRSAPLVLWIDDAQWGDLDSADLLGELFRTNDARILLLLSFTSEDAATSLFLQRLDASSRSAVIVPPLPHDEARTLARILVGIEADPNRIEQIARESGGNAFLLEELSRYAVDHPDRSPSLLRVFRSRLEILPDEAKALLHFIALAGEPLSSDIALKAAGAERTEEDLFSILRDARLIRSRITGDLEEVEIYHTRIRELVTQQLDSDEQRGVHAALAQVLEESKSAEAETLATHYYAAGMSEKAARYAIEGGDLAYRALAFDRAARLYLLALQLSPESAESAIGDRLGHALENARRS